MMDSSHTETWLQPARILSEGDTLPHANTSSVFLRDVQVADLLEQYKSDTELLKHILAAKTEEDKRRAAENIRRAEEARLESKYLDMMERDRRTSDPSTMTNSYAESKQCQDRPLSSRFGTDVFSVSTAAGPHSEWNTGRIPMMVPMVLSPQSLGNTPPSPAMSMFFAPSSPYTSLNASPSEHAFPVSSYSDPETAVHAPRSDSIDSLSVSSPISQPSPQSKPRKPRKHTPPNMKPQRKTGQSTKHTKRTRQSSQRFTSKNWSHQLQMEKFKETQLDHNMVMQALRRKLMRCPQSNQAEDQQMNTETNARMADMSPSGMLLLNVKKNTKSTARRPHAASRYPRRATSVHTDKSKK